MNDTLLMRVLDGMANVDEVAATASDYFDRSSP